ncbi:Secreted subtilisin-like serine protease sub4 [Ophidiomyces ophidiicola]|uniref:Secreted subtilisin-like serine protease sub4 n=1 Tax=Ophidiomyces ophidiicola TaxID=1387563 RepID=UPI0020C1CAEC|nr:Secreted subtilisin-like serine protease sub4 [Ophidiomyces ophidiicola]KAI1925675.1 Secreted subtilisin-like serine protease sub4 [Ophidiomyces ophidiicola]KAI1942305.1 Secreted subtilisin-like serine protease sub4 [Ophidiomyces ophidiicola]KAI2138688.1 Secreted subtilisin-like serine protease sub4 [Ophidiomyces ophidiicola]KAI2154575.1 Secreted subtilisin-like serine protease sub4 [Ophidiomyces ophidiicola]KAI2393323.1 Secreted subtilisin-like serine protease sub4 [Ophidiomyces ophidiicol
MVSMKFLSVLLSALAAVDAAEVLSVSNKKDIIPDSYIVVLKDEVPDSEVRAHVSWVQTTQKVGNMKRNNTVSGLKSTFHIGQFQGYLGSFDQDTLAKILRDDKVKYVEPNRIMKIQGVTEQRNAPWGLGRISSQQPGSDTYVYDESAGRGIIIYGVDSGIDVSHPDFEGRATWGTNTVDNDDTDGNGHGTHTAGTFAGSTYGVAKHATIVGVKVLDAGGSGSNSAIIAGIDWCVNHARENNALGRAVMNLSLGGGYSEATNSAAERAVAAGIFLAVAAGNDNVSDDSVLPFRPACANYKSYYSKMPTTILPLLRPMSAPLVRPIARMSELPFPTTAPDVSSDHFYNVLIILTCQLTLLNLVDIFAPGVDVVSSTVGGGSGPMSGTSMAAPHIAGLGAYLMALENIPAGQVCDRIKQLSLNAVRNEGPGSTTQLANNGASNLKK